MFNVLWNTPISVGSVLIKNRIEFPPLSGNWANEDGSVSKKIIRFYQNISQGGVGMVVVGGTAISRDSKGSDRSLCLYDESHLYGFELLANTIKQHNCLTLIQLMHVGGQGNPVFTSHIPISPSGLKSRALGFETRALNIEDIKNIRNDFVNSAVLAEKANYDGIELHLAHGYLLHEFISPHSNNRDDEYGGRLENRLRLIIEVISQIRDKVPELIIGVRVSGEDYMDDGINMEVNREYLPLLEKAGVEYFSITAGTYETSRLKHEAMAKGKFFNYSREIKSIVSKPVIGVGKILNLDMAEEHLKKKDCDIVAIGRGLIADPMMIAKVLSGENFNECTGCGECQYLKYGKKELNCPLNEITCLKEEKF